MNEPIAPTSAVSALRRLLRRKSSSELARISDETSDHSASGDLPAIMVTRVVEQPPAPKADATVFAAQVLGQGGQKRGLKAGSEALERARATYLETEWSGPADRRIRRGRITKTEI
jgi:hypothetical protein